MFIAQRLVEPSKQIIQNQNNIVKNSSWPEANQLAIEKCDHECELRATTKQIQAVVRLGIAVLRVKYTDHPATHPPLSLKLNSLSIVSNGHHTHCSSEVTYKTK